MDWLKTKLEDYSKRKNEMDEKTKLKTDETKEREKEIRNLGQKHLHEIILPKLRELRKQLNEHSFNCEIKEIPFHLENVNENIIGSVEFSILFQKGIPPLFIKISPLSNAPKFHCEYMASKKQAPQTLSFNYDEFTTNSFEGFLQKYIDELLN